MKDTLEKIIRTLRLKPHPEGGYYRETYRSSGKIGKDVLGDKYTGPRNYSTCIYYLLTSENFSAFHRIVQDEIWHFYDGAPINLHMISPQGTYSKSTIGRNMSEGQVPQLIVPAATWFGANITTSNSYSLVGCTVSPGFDFADFEPGNRDLLIHHFPQHQSVIMELTRS